MLCIEIEAHPLWDVQRRWSSSFWLKTKQTKNCYFLFSEGNATLIIISSWGTQAGIQKPLSVDLSVGYILNTECYINVSKYRIVKIIYWMSLMKLNPNVKLVLISISVLGLQFNWMQNSREDTVFYNTIAARWLQCPKNLFRGQRDPEEQELCQWFISTNTVNEI